MLRAFELDGAEVVWPFEVRVQGELSEQIDGAIYAKGLSCLVESKDTEKAIRIDPIERALSDAFGVQIFNRDVYMFDHIPAIIEPTSVAMIVVGAFVCALLFAAAPAWRAARLDPLAALRYE